MPNYGHAVSIGALIDAGIAAHEAADLAARADEAGLDLALFTDPDDAGAPARSSDPLALATWAAGRTERITVGAAGLKMTNRQPSVLARAAGSLSALSGNRAVLSLAVPGDPQVHVDEDGRERTDELTDVIGVFRAVLDTSAERATYTGAHHEIGRASCRERARKQVISVISEAYAAAS